MKKEIIEIKEEVQIGDVILEKGDKVQILKEAKIGQAFKNLYKGLEILAKYDPYAYVDKNEYLCVESSLIGDDFSNPDVKQMYFWSWEWDSESDYWVLWIGER